MYVCHAARANPRRERAHTGEFGYNQRSPQSFSRLTVQVVIYSLHRREIPEGINGNASHPGYRVDKQCTRDPQCIDIFSFTLARSSHITAPPQG